MDIDELLDIGIRSLSTEAHNKALNRPEPFSSVLSAINLAFK